MQHLVSNALQGTPIKEAKAVDAPPAACTTPVPAPFTPCAVAHEQGAQCRSKAPSTSRGRVKKSFTFASPVAKCKPSEPRPQSEEVPAGDIEQSLLCDEAPISAVDASFKTPSPQVQVKRARSSTVAVPAERPALAELATPYSPSRQAPRVLAGHSAAPSQVALLQPLPHAQKPTLLDDLQAALDAPEAYDSSLRDGQGPSGSETEDDSDEEILCTPKRRICTASLNAYMDGIAQDMELDGEAPSAPCKPRLRRPAGWAGQPIPYGCVSFSTLIQQNEARQAAESMLAEGQAARLDELWTNIDSLGVVVDAKLDVAAAAARMEDSDLDDEDGDDENQPLPPLRTDLDRLPSLSCWVERV